jgi:hypothetical protein
MELERNTIKGIHTIIDKLFRSSNTIFETISVILLLLVGVMEAFHNTTEGVSLRGKFLLLARFSNETILNPIELDYLAPFTQSYGFLDC